MSVAIKHSFFGVKKWSIDLRTEIIIAALGVDGNMICMIDMFDMHD